MFEIAVWPLSRFEDVSPKNKLVAKPAKAHLDGLERLIAAQAAHSRFKAIFNEKNPPAGTREVEAPPSLWVGIVSERVLELRYPLDFRIARRALIMWRLAQVTSERQVKDGLRRGLLTQAQRRASAWNGLQGAFEGSGGAA